MKVITSDQAGFEELARSEGVWVATGVMSDQGEAIEKYRHVKPSHRGFETALEYALERERGIGVVFIE